MKRKVLRCTSLIDEMTHVEREVLLKYLISKRISISVLGEDLLTVICKYLKPSDRLAFLNALSRPQVMTLNYKKTRRTTLYPSLRQYPILTATLCVERATINLIMYIHKMADRLLYKLQPPTTIDNGPMMFVACNWSTFKSQKLDSLAMIRWSHTPPHARVQVLEQIVRVVVASNLARYLPIISLAAYKTVSNSDKGMRVRVHNANMRITEEPMQTETFDLFSGLEDDARSIMQRNDLRKMLWSRLISGDD